MSEQTTSDKAAGIAASLDGVIERLNRAAEVPPPPPPPGNLTEGEARFARSLRFPGEADQAATAAPPAPPATADRAAIGAMTPGAERYARGVKFDTGRPPSRDPWLNPIPG
jgi:hypothetical protein